MTDISTVLHLLDEARGFAALSPAGRENISEAIDILEAINTRPAAPVEGLVRYNLNASFDGPGDAFCAAVKSKKGVFVRFDQAEAIIAAERANTETALEQRNMTIADLARLEADNASLTGRVKAQVEHIATLESNLEAMEKRAKTLETQLTAAKDALEIVANAHASNPSLAMADVPEADYVRHVLYEMRKLARAALEDRS